jgi:hypothetical protein
MSISPKAMKLLEALAGDHNTPNDGDHAWRICRRCLAEEELATAGAHKLVLEIHAAAKAWARREP